MIRRQGYRFCLMPNAAEASLLRRFLGASRFVWNAILAENDHRHAVGDDLSLSHGAFCERLRILKSRHAFLREVHSQPLQQTLRDLAQAYRNAFDPKLAADFPMFKKKFKPAGIRFPQGFKVERNGVYLPKIGWIPFRVSKRTAKRSVRGTIKNVTVCLEGGWWYVVFQSEGQVAEPAHKNPQSSVGIDLGVARFAALSDGAFFDGANAFRKHENHLALRQRQLARKRKFSANWRKAKQKVAEINTRIANVRKDMLHKASATICKNHAVVVMEDLRIGNMTRSAKGTVEDPGRNVTAKSGLNRRILDQGWGELRRQIGYKSAWLGGELILVDARNTSRTCSVCGHVSADNRKTQSEFSCVACGYVSNADHNAARNILGRAGWARIACGDSVEAGSALRRLAAPGILGL